MPKNSASNFMYFYETKTFIQGSHGSFNLNDCRFRPAVSATRKKGTDTGSSTAQHLLDLDCVENSCNDEENCLGTISIGTVVQVGKTSWENLRYNYNRNSEEH
jgi:hypothetical protein